MEHGEKSSSLLFDAFIVVFFGFLIFSNASAELGSPQEKYCKPVPMNLPRGVINGVAETIRKENPKVDFEGGYTIKAPTIIYITGHYYVCLQSREN